MLKIRTFYIPPVVAVCASREQHLSVMAVNKAADYIKGNKYGRWRCSTAKTKQVCIRILHKAQ
jgi:hypothetical protein